MPFNAEEVERARRETPGAARVAHLNNAGSALPPAPVTDTVIDHLRLESETGGYEAADAVRPRIEGVYGSIARLIGAGADEIAVVENATRAWDMAFYALMFKPGTGSSPRARSTRATRSPTCRWRGAPAPSSR